VDATNISTVSQQYFKWKFLIYKTDICKQRKLQNTTSRNRGTISTAHQEKY